MSNITISIQNDLASAIRIFEELPPYYQLATLHPSYVAADACRDNRLSPVYWMARDDDKIFLYCFHVCTTHLNNGQRILDIESPYGYGGPLTNTDDTDFLSKVNIRFNHWAKSKGILAEFVRLHPLMHYQSCFFDAIAFNREVVYIDLRNNFFTEYSARRRTYIRRTFEKHHSLEMAQSDDRLAIFKRLYNETMHRLNANAFYFFSDLYFDNLIKVPGASCWLLRSGEDYLAGALIMASPSSGIVEYHLGAHDPRLASGGLVFLLHLVAEHFRGKGYDTFYLGGGRSAENNDSLLLFKKGFSKRTTTFNLAYKIHDPSRYYQLRAQLDCSGSEKILFYRN